MFKRPGAKKKMNHRINNASPQLKCNLNPVEMQFESWQTRRTFLIATGALVTASRSLAQNQLTPDAAVGELLAGNKRFTAGRLTAFEQDLLILKQKSAEKQEPFAAVLSCADSRVPVELIFDQSIGHIFVTRVAGNVVTPEIIASLEYGAIVLGVKAILVMGHANCGAVKAAIQGKGGSRADKRSVPTYPASGRSGRIEFRSSGQGKYKASGSLVGESIHGHLRPGEGKET